MNDKVRVTIRQAYFSTDLDQVQWEVILPNGRLAMIPIDRVDFGPTIGVNYDIPPKLVQEYCGKMVGQQIWIQPGEKP